MHPRNLHQGQYDLQALAKAIPDLKAKLVKREEGFTLDFSDPESVRLLNQALLKYHYNIDYWNIPEGYLCPPIPSRSDYIHYIADYISEGGELLRGRKITLLDIGTGANVIYPLVAHKLYGWKCIATDIDATAIKCAKGIIDVNDLKKTIDIRLQPNNTHFFQNVLREKEYITITVCNPPFYTSEEDATEQNQRKNKGLHGKEELMHNFSGAPHELWTEGGELQFIKSLIAESFLFSRSLKWVSTLVSKKEHLNKLTPILESHELEHDIIPMQHGNKSTNILIWKVGSK